VLLLDCLFYDLKFIKDAGIMKKNTQSIAGFIDLLVRELSAQEIVDYCSLGPD